MSRVYSVLVLSLVVSAFAWADPITTFNPGVGRSGGAVLAQGNSSIFVTGAPAVLAESASTSLSGPLYAAVLTGSSGNHAIQFIAGGSMHLSAAGLNNNSLFLGGRFTGIEPGEKDHGRQGSGYDDIENGRGYNGGNGNAGGNGNGHGSLNTAPVPEPASIVLLSLVLLACTTILRRHRFNRQA